MGGGGWRETEKLNVGAPSVGKGRLCAECCSIICFRMRGIKGGVEGVNASMCTERTGEFRARKQG